MTPEFTSYAEVDCLVETRSHKSNALRPERGGGGGDVFEKKWPVQQWPNWTAVLLHHRNP